MRALGIPARIVTGYQGGELNTRRRLLDRCARATPTPGPRCGWTAAAGCGSTRPRAVAPGRIGAFQRLRAAARRVRRRHRHRQPDLAAAPARRLGGGEQRLEPVGAELHAEPPAQPAEEPRLRRAELGRPGYVLLALLVARQPGRRRLDAVGAQPARPLAAPAGPRARSGCDAPASTLPDAAPPRQMAQRCHASASAPARRRWRDWLLQARSAALRPRARRRACAALRREFRRLAWPALNACRRAALLPRGTIGDASPLASTRLRCRWPRLLAAAARHSAARPQPTRRTPRAAARPTPTRDDAMQFADDVAARRDLDRDWVRATIGQRAAACRTCRA